MAINYKDLYDKAFRGNRIESTSGPVVTSDEVAVEIQKGTDEFGGEVATGFTSLTDHNCSKCYSSQVIS